MPCAIIPTPSITANCICFRRYATFRHARAGPGPTLSLHPFPTWITTDRPDVLRVCRYTPIAFFSIKHYEGVVVQDRSHRGPPFPGSTGRDFRKPVSCCPSSNDCHSRHRVAPIKSSMSRYTLSFCSKKIVSRAILSFRSIRPPEGFSAWAALTPERGGPGQDQTLFCDRAVPSVASQNDLKFFRRQSSLPCTYAELTAGGRPCRSSWHSVASAGHSASGTSGLGRVHRHPRT